jgi:hypothetical protein
MIKVDEYRKEAIKEGLMLTPTNVLNSSAGKLMINN